MSRTAKVTAEFGGDERVFCLRWGEIIELQEARDAGPSFILARMIGNQWHVQDVAEVIRLGLIGGGESPGPAKKLVRQHVEERPFDLGGENGLLMLAVTILAAGIHGAPDEPPGKSGEIASGSTISPTERSASAPSSAVLS